ncbi:MAG: hypothetical protein ABIH21_04995 [Patescibacteria group bacterium]
MAIINLYKPLGWTPLRAMEQLRVVHPELKDSKMVYAGRLDPMAEGVLVVLTDEDRFDHQKLLDAEKEYEATFLFGYQTDTYDVLGIASKGSGEQGELRGLKESLGELRGIHKFPFPAYSAYRVKGKPLHWWAQMGRLDEIQIPIKEMEVLGVSNVRIEKRNSDDVLEDILRRIKFVHGEFRQDKILKQWPQVLEKEQELTTVSLTLEVRSGTYIRSLAHELGQKLGCGGVLLGLKRTSVGDYKIEDSVLLNRTSENDIK